MYVKMMTCTSFLLVDKVITGFEALQESPAYEPQMDVIFDYLGQLCRPGPLEWQLSCTIVCNRHVEHLHLPGGGCVTHQ